MNTLTMSPAELVTALGGPAKTDRIILSDPILGAEYGAGTPDQESPVEIDLMYPHANLRGYYAVALLNDRDEIDAFQLLIAGTTHATNLSKLPKKDRQVARARGVMSNIISLGPLAIISGDRQEKIQQIFQGIFEKNLPEYRAQMISAPKLHSGDLRVYGGKRNSAKAVSRGAKHLLINLESGDLEDVKTMFDAGITAGWIDPSNINNSLRRLTDILTAESLTISTDLKNGSFQYRWSPQTGIVASRRISFTTSLGAEKISKSFDNFLVAPQIIKKDGIAKGAILQFVPTEENYDLLLKKLKTLADTVHDEVLIYRALLSQ